MTNVLKEAESILMEAKYNVVHFTEDGKEYLAFENNALFGFLQSYNSIDDLLSSWRDDKDKLLRKFTPQFRVAGPKAWNVYTVLVASDNATEIQYHALQDIEEDLSETRKIARSNLETADDVSAALLSLLPFAYIPILPPLDIRAEIAMRAQELPEKALNAFLSDSDLTEVAKLLEEN